MNFILTWLDVGFDYLVAAVLIVAGLYLAIVLCTSPALALFSRAIRFAGLALIGAGLIIGAIAYGEANGARKCEEAWKAKKYEAQIDRLKQERDAKNIAAAAAAQEAQQLASQNDDMQKQLVEFQDAARSLPTCRRATVDDDRRLCAILGAAAAGCRPSR